MAGPASPILGLAGWSGSGKTTMVRALIPRLVMRGLRVSTVKHAHHDFDIDQPGKDSYIHRDAGAVEVLISSDQRWALMHELRGQPEPDLDALIDRMMLVDLVIVEGFKRHRHPKLEIHRPALGKPLLAHEDPDIVAVATDAPLADLDRRQIALGDMEAIADFAASFARASGSRAGG